MVEPSSSLSQNQHQKRLKWNNKMTEERQKTTGKKILSSTLQPSHSTLSNINELPLITLFKNSSKDQVIVDKSDIFFI